MMNILKKYGGFIALALVVVGILMLFINPAIKYTGKVITTTGYTGWEAVFGSKTSTSFGDIETLKANALGIVGLILVAAGAAIPLLPFVPANFKFIIGAVAIIIGAVFFFVCPTTLGKGYGPATALILTGVFTLIGGLINGVLGFMNFKK